MMRLFDMCHQEKGQLQLFNTRCTGLRQGGVRKDEAEWA